MLSRLPSCGGGAIRAMSGYARTPKPPYYAVIFTSERTSNTQARWKQEMRWGNVGNQFENELYDVSEIQV